MQKNQNDMINYSIKSTDQQAQNITDMNSPKYPGVNLCKLSLGPQVLQSKLYPF